VAELAAEIGRLGADDALKASFGGGTPSVRVFRIRRRASPPHPDPGPRPPLASGARA
jgi:hypothetical protein